MKKARRHVGTEARRVGLVALLCCSPLSSARGDDLRDHENAQRAIQGETVSVSDQLDGVLAEFKSNGIAGGDEVKALERIRGVLGNLSGEQMEQVVALLQQARAGNSPGKVSEAYGQQKQIISKLSELLQQYETQAAREALSNKLNQLADRENANQKATEELIRQTRGRQVQQFDPGQSNQLRMRISEQGALKDEVSKAMADLKNLSDAMPNEPRVAEAERKAEAQEVEKTATAAANDTASAKLPYAVDEARTTRDGLRDLAEQIDPPKDKTAALKDQQAKLADAIDKQQAVIDDTKNMGERRAAVTEAKQADVQDEVKQAAKKLQATAPQAAKSLEAAQQPMQDARQALSKQQRDVAMKQEKQALGRMQQAKADLDQQVEKAEDAKAQADAKEAAKDLPAMEAARDKVTEALGKQAEALAAAQAGENPEAVAKDQQQKAADAAKQAGDQIAKPQAGEDGDRESPAKNLADAQKAMAGAKHDLEKKDADAAEPQQKQAIAELKKAKDGLDQQIEKAEQAAGQPPDEKKQQQAMDETVRELKAAQAEVKEAQKELANSNDAKKAEDNPHTQAAAKHLEKAASAITKASAQDQKDVAKAAREAMKEAQGQVEQGIENAKKGGSQQAKDNAQKAEQALANAMKAGQGEALAKAEQPSDQQPQKPNPDAANRDPKEAKAGEEGDPAGARAEAKGGGGYTGLPARDRAALQQSQGEKYPAEYGPMVEQYYRNLSDEGK